MTNRLRKARRIEALERRELLAADVVTNEIHYDPEPKTEFVEFIELFNLGDQTADLSGWKLTDAVDYEFPNGTLLAPNTYLVISQNPDAVKQKFGVESLGPWIGKLSTTGETILLQDAADVTRDRVDYQLGFPWPTVGDAPGHSIELIHPTLDNQLGGSWRPSVGTAPRIAAGATWSIFPGITEASEPADAWRRADFDDSSWEKGVAPIGMGEDFVVTELDARNNYGTVFLRNTFTIEDVSTVDSLALSVMFDDGVNIWINGTHVASENVFEENLPVGIPANSSIEVKEFVDIALPSPAEFLVNGHNVIAVQLINAKLSDRDLFFDAQLWSSNDRRPEPSPGAMNSVARDEAPPQIRQVGHQPNSPESGQDVFVSAKVTDPDGVQSVALQYQIVNPGDYIRVTDERYETEWTTLAMLDDGTQGDFEAGDQIFSAVVPGHLQSHRRLVRYRIEAVDGAGESVLVPYADDPQPNFAYFVYDGVPAWTGADQPGETAAVTFGEDVMDQLPVYHLIALEDDVITSQYRVEDRRFRGTMVYEGRVYDHIEFRSRGEFSTFVSGKNKWKFFFNRGHDFQARDNYGRAYDQRWRVMNFSNAATPWVTMNRGMAGIGEAIAYELYDLAGVPSSDTSFLQFRVIDDAQESPPDQYSGDLWGLYLTLEHPDGRFLDERGLPDGTTYKVESSQGDIKNQGPTQPEARDDFMSFMREANRRSTPEEWWRENIDLDSYFAFRAINRAVNNMDIRDGWNHYVYHNPETNKWSVIPWDLDMLYVPTTHWSGVIRLENMLRHDGLALEYGNRARELQDLLFNQDQVDQLVDEFAAFVNPQTGGMTMVDVDQFMWNYHPRTSRTGQDAHRGMFNRQVAHYNRFQGPGGERTMVSGDHEGFAQWIKDFMLPAPGEGSDPSGYGANLLDRHARDADIPETPTIRYVGADGFAPEGLAFENSQFQDPQGDDTFASMQWRLAEVANPLAANYDAAAPRRYEIQATWESDELTTFQDRINVPADVVEVGHTYRARVRMKDTTGRWSHWSDPTQFTAGINTLTPAVEDLRVTEIHYNPQPGPNSLLNAGDLEFVELANLGNRPLDLSGVKFDDGIQFDFSNASTKTLDAGQRLVLVRDQVAFEAFYGTDITIAGQYGGEGGTRLSNAGEQIRLIDSSGAIIQQFTYQDQGSWPARSDGGGSSLEMVNPRGSSSAPSNWRASSTFGGTPGRESADVRSATVVVNEVLAADSTDDRIELKNTGTQSLDVSGWYVTDSSDNYFKYQVPAGTTISAGGYAVLSLPNSELDIGGSVGGQLWMLTVDNEGRPLHFVDPVSFGAAPVGVAVGRLPDGVGPHQPLNRPTLGSSNAGRWLGDLLISEVNYAPADPDGPRGLRADDFEFIELHNRSTQPVDLGDWRVTGAASMSFPPGTLIPPGGTQLLVSFDPLDTRKTTVFRFAYNVGADVVLHGPYEDDLDDEGGQIGLEFTFGSGRAVVLADRISYENAAPWPAIVPDSGDSLTRLRASQFGDDPTQWRAASITPGVVDFVMRLPGDSNGDGRFDQLDIASVLQAGKYLGGTPADFAEGDWNDDGVFDSLDIVTALQSGRYLQ